MRSTNVSRSFTDHCSARLWLSEAWLVVVFFLELALVSGCYHLLITALLTRKHPFTFNVYTISACAVGVLCLIIAVWTALWLKKWMGISCSEIDPVSPDELIRDRLFTIHDVTFTFNGPCNITLHCSCMALGDTTFTIVLDFASLLSANIKWQEVSRATPSTLTTTQYGTMTLHVSPEIPALDKIRCLLSEVTSPQNAGWLRRCFANTKGSSDGAVDSLRHNHAIPEPLAQLCVRMSPPNRQDQNGAVLVVNNSPQNDNAGCTIGFIPTGNPERGFIPTMVRRFLIDHPEWGVYQTTVSGYIGKESDCSARWDGKTIDQHVLYIFKKESGDSAPDATVVSEAVPATECESCAEGDESHHSS